jgi:DNA (cytosine-5)-methyltransferase 1
MIEIDEEKRGLAGVRFIDLFAGIGGFRLALNSVGATCVFSSEWNGEAQKIYQANFGELPEGDITKISADDIPPHEILCAGFPCQAFSISGKPKGFEDARGTSFFEIARIARHHEPKMLLLENVRNFVRHDGGRTLQTVHNILDELGYDVFYDVLNASDFGVPQNRERLYVLAFRKTLNVKDFQFPKPDVPSRTLHDIVLPDAETQSFRISRDDVQLQDVTPNRNIFGNLPSKPIRIGTIGKGGQGERIYHEEGHAITLSAYGGGIGAKTGCYIINGILRKLAPRECARLMGFPDTFIIHENKNQAYKQFGNSMVMDVLQHILLAVINQNVLSDLDLYNAKSFV